MPPKAQFIFSFVCSLVIIVHLGFGLPAAGHRQKRQSFDFSSNTDDTKNNVDGEPTSTTTSWQDSQFHFNDGATISVEGGNEDKTFDFENAGVSLDAADRAPIVAADDMDPSFYADYGGGDNDYPPMYPGDYYYEGEEPGTNGSESCDDLCRLQCGMIGECDNPQCVNYTCEDYDYDESPLPPTTSNTRKTNVPEEGTTLEPEKGHMPGTEETTTLRPLSERRCPTVPLLRCIHGFCKNGPRCQCDEGWYGVTCRYPCTLKCVHGNCLIRPDVEMLETGKSEKDITEEDMFCNCEHGYGGTRCEEKTPNKVALAEEKARKLAIILGTCLTLAILTSVILPIILWKKRVIFVMRVVYFFKMWEDNDGKRYDAYISAGTMSRSLKFVKNVLVPKLEQQGFKLFIPSRDQLCGAVISEDIITAIKESRRTIMVVTPEYLQNDWSGFEVLNAQVEMIKLQQRVIPIILEDVSEEAPRMRKSLKHILESVKCLKVPGYKSTDTEFQLISNSKSKKKIDKFWRRLELTMPKKRELHSSFERSCHIQKYLPVQQNMLDDKHSKSVPVSHISTDREQTYDSIEENAHTKSYDTMVDSKINPLSVYQISSNDQEIDVNKYEQCFNFKTAL